MSATVRHAHRRSVDRTITPRTQRRVSGPVVRRPVAVPGGATVGRQTAFARVRALPDSRWLDRALRGRLWIWLLGAALLGVVFMQVSLLKLNSGIGRAVEATATLERQNSALEAAIARLSDPDRVQKGAALLGMLSPKPGDVGYLTPRPVDASRAVETMQPPSPEAAALLANDGVVPGSLIAAPAPDPAMTVATTTTPAAAITPTTDPAATATAPAAPATDPAVPVP
jgi:hypothetical protein